MKIANYIISGIMGAAGVAFLMLSRTYTAAMDSTSTAGTWPGILSWILIGLAVLLALTNTFSKNIPPSAVNIHSAEFRAVLIMIGAVLIYMLSYRFLGCLITNAVFIPFFLYFLGERNKKLIVIYDICVLAAIYLVFEVVLSSKLAPLSFL
ncbi:MAG: tripartite tricarboxylate transporter TctB family protein [Dorea sp.]|nr:tripartite tricarboxylate transporter TctB family protein [Dorea sp.]